MLRAQSSRITARKRHARPARLRHLMEQLARSVPKGNLTTWLTLLIVRNVLSTLTFLLAVLPIRALAMQEPRDQKELHLVTCAHPVDLAPLPALPTAQIVRRARFTR